MSEDSVGCARPTGSVLGGAKPREESSVKQEQEVTPMETARVGFKAPDFEAPAYHKGKFTSVKLSDHLGKWIMLCFYPGDFTFV